MRYIALLTMLFWGTSALWAADPLAAWKAQKRKSSPQRYEGSLVELASYGPWEILSFGAPIPRFGKNVKLNVRFHRGAGQSVVVVARELETLKYYRMETTPIEAEDTFTGWPTKDEIDRLGVPPENLGVVAYLNGADSAIPHVSPVVVAVDQPAASTGDAAGSGGYELWVRADSALIDVQYSCEPPQSSGEGKASGPNPVTSMVEGRRPFRIPLECVMSNHPGKWKIIVEGSDPLETAESSRLVFYAEISEKLP